jgi:N-acetylneuraminic acid mutarotase
VRSLLPRAGLAILAGAAAASVAVVVASGEPNRTERRGGGTWDSTLSQSPFERSEVGAARIGDRIYVVGGFFGDGRTTGRMAAYDISEDQWIKRRTLPKPTNHPGVAALDGKLYVLGGRRTSQQRTSDSLFRYTPAKNRWRRLPDAPTARAAMGLAATGDRLYAVGGHLKGNFEVRRLEVYDVSQRRWRRRAAMPTGRNHLTALFARGTLWAIGGRQSGGANLATVERYDPEENEWSDAPSLNVARSGIASVVAARSIVVFGGEDLGPGGSTIAEVERLPFADLDGPWQLIESMPVPRHGLGGAAKDDFVYALEGGPMPGLHVSNLVERLDLSGL